MLSLHLRSLGAYSSLTPLRTFLLLFISPFLPLLGSQNYFHIFLIVLLSLIIIIVLLASLQLGCGRKETRDAIIDFIQSLLFSA